MKSLKDFLVPTIVLAVICMIVTAALVITYNVTAPIIAAGKEKETVASRTSVLPGAVDFEEIKITLPENGLDIYEETSGLGFVIRTKAKGYGGDLVVMTGINRDGRITGIKVLESSETAGLGTNIEKPEYLKQYQNKDSELGKIDAISGATISSNALKSAVQTAFECFNMAKDNTQVTAQSDLAAGFTAGKAAI